MDIGDDLFWLEVRPGGGHIGLERLAWDQVTKGFTLDCSDMEPSEYFFFKKILKCKMYAETCTYDKCSA